MQWDFLMTGTLAELAHVNQPFMGKELEGFACLRVIVIAVYQSHGMIPPWVRHSWYYCLSTKLGFVHTHFIAKPQEGRNKMKRDSVNSND